MKKDTFYVWMLHLNSFSLGLNMINLKYNYSGWYLLITILLSLITTICLYKVLKYYGKDNQ